MVRTSVFAALKVFIPQLFCCGSRRRYETFSMFHSTPRAALYSNVRRILVKCGLAEHFKSSGHVGGCVYLV